MKVLVHFEQEYIVNGPVRAHIIETITRVFEVESKEHLLSKFHNLKYAPEHFKNFSKSELDYGKKTMIWYLPETFEPHF